jgi:predicted permease
MDTLVQDLRIAVRSLRKSWSFTAVAILCLALGTGATTAIFAVVNAVLLRPLPYPAPEQLVRMYGTQTNDERWTASVSPANYLDWRRENTVFEQLVAYVPGSANLAGDGPPERLTAVRATANLFAMLRVPPALGRTFLQAEDQPGAQRVVVLSDAIWHTRFGADPAIIGRSITLDGESYTVVGIMPPSFAFPATRAIDVWLPLTFTPAEAAVRGNNFMQVVGRLEPGVTIAAARSQMRQIAARLARQYPDDDALSTVKLLSLHDDLFGRMRPQLLVLLGASVLVLLVACVNVANLLLARAATRRREVAVRAALGAGRGRLVRQFLTESVVLSLLGGAAGLALAHGGVRALVTLAAQDIPSAQPVGFDPGVFAFLLAVALATGIGFGLVPALQGAHVDPRDGLAEGGRGGSTGRAQQRFRSSLVAAELALALVLVIGAGLLLKAFLHLAATPSGLKTDHVLTLRVSLPEQKYQDHASDRFYRPVLERVAALPGVASAGWISVLPIQDYWYNGTFAIEGRPPAPRGQEPLAEHRAASPGYFAALGIPIRAGRTFSDQDAPGAPTAVIINEAFVHKYFPHENPIGHRLLLDSLALTIVGVVGDVRGAGLDRAPMPEFYVSYLQLPEFIPSSMTLVVHTTMPPTSLTSAIRGAIQSVDPAQPIYNVETMDRVVAESLSNQRLYLWLLGTFAGIALVLAAAGIYGVTSYLVTQRTREMGIRLALGAESKSLVALVVRQGASVAALGTLAGLVGAYALTRALSSLLYGVSATDPVVFGGVAALLVTVALVACYIPARRATRVDPVIALKDE